MENRLLDLLNPVQNPLHHIVQNHLILLQVCIVNLSSDNLIDSGRDGISILRIDIGPDLP